MKVNKIEKSFCRYLGSLGFNIKTKQLITVLISITQYNLIDQPKLVETMYYNLAIEVDRGEGHSRILTNFIFYVLLLKTSLLEFK